MNGGLEAFLTLVVCKWRFASIGRGRRQSILWAPLPHRPERRLYEYDSLGL
ncbi:hypothetical protein DEU38_103416 [Rhodococcus sp. AG1013]|nr:hypothetical protein DEU38_103416 [Rhodococcus sp. AG1013]